MDWCLAQIGRASRGEGTARGLVRGPLNDLTGQGIWAFNQAYLFAGLDCSGARSSGTAIRARTEARQAAADDA